MRIPGIYWFYDYRAGRKFEAPFTMHSENGNLLSINYLYEGDKVWITVLRIYIKFLEEKFKKTNFFYYQSDCAQFLRHSATYFSIFILNE